MCIVLYLYKIAFALTLLTKHTFSELIANRGFAEEKGQAIFVKYVLQTNPSIPQRKKEKGPLLHIFIQRI